MIQHTTISVDCFDDDEYLEIEAETTVEEIIEFFNEYKIEYKSIIKNDNNIQIELVERLNASWTDEYGQVDLKVRIGDILYVEQGEDENWLGLIQGGITDPSYTEGWGWGA